MYAQLKLLRIFHYILAAISLLHVLGMLGVIGYGTYDSFFTGRRATDEDICALICCAVFLFIIALSAVGNFLAAGWTITGRRRTLCIAVAVLNIFPISSGCLPAGIALGIYALIVLMKPEVKTFFRNIERGMPLDEALLQLDEPPGPRGSRTRGPRSPRRSADEDDFDVNGDWDSNKQNKQPGDWDRPAPAKPKPKNNDDWR